MLKNMITKSIFVLALVTGAVFFVSVVPAWAFIEVGMGSYCCGVAGGGAAPDCFSMEAEGGFICRGCIGQPCGPDEHDESAGRGTCQAEGGDLAEINCLAAGTSDEETDKADEPKATTPTLKPRYLDNPLGTSSLAEIIARIISIFTGVSGSIALLMFVYGGIMWLTSGGDSGKVEAGRKAMVWAVIGLIVIFGSYAILLFIFEAIGASTLL